MRAGMDTLLSKVVLVFGAAQPHHAYLFANARGSIEDFYTRRVWYVDVHETFGRRNIQLATRLERVEAFPQP